MDELQELREAEKMAAQAGDYEAAAVLADQIAQMQAQPKTAKDMMQPPEPAQAGRETRATQELPELGQGGLLSGLDIDPSKASLIGTAIMSTTDESEVAKILQNASPDIGIQYDEKGNIIAANNKTGARVVLNKPGMSRIDVLRTLGIASAFTPAGAAKSAGLKAALSVGGKSALTEAGLQQVQETAGGDFDTEEVLLSGGLGAAGQAVGDAIGTGYRALRGKPSAELQDVVKQGEAFDVPIMSTDIKPPQTFAGKTGQRIGERIPLAGTGGQRAAQLEARDEAAQRFADRYGTFSYDDIVQSIRSKKDRIFTAAGNVLNKVEDRVTGEIQPTKTLDVLGSVKDDLTQPNIIQDEGLAGDVGLILRALQEPQTYSSLKQNRTALGDMLQAAGRGERSQLPTKARAQLSRIYRAMSDDMEAAVKPVLDDNEFRQWQQANRVYAREAEQMKRSRIKSILDRGDVTPENVAYMLRSNKPSEVRQLYQSLDQSGRENARAALIQHAYDQASKGKGGFSAQKFEAELRKIAPNTQIFFRGEQREALNGFKKMLEYTQRASEAGVVTPTGQEVVGVLGVAGGVTMPMETVVGGISTGAFARLYESKKVRDILIKLAGTPRNSTKFDSLVNELTPYMNAAMQADRRVDTDEQEDN